MQFATLGGEMAGTAFLGYLVDLYFQTIPVCTVIGAILGVFSSGMHLYRMLSEMNQSEKSKKEGQPGAK